MGRFTQSLGTLTIAAAGTTSPALIVPEDTVALVVFGPSALTGTVTVQVEPTRAGTDFLALQSGGSDVTIPANKATPIPVIAFRQLRLVSGSAEAIARVFTIEAQCETAGGL